MACATRPAPDTTAGGLHKRQIGGRRYLAEKTVKNDVSNGRMKLGMSRRSEAAACSARLAERQRHGSPGG